MFESLDVMSNTNIKFPQELTHSPQIQAYPAPLVLGNCGLNLHATLSNCGGPCISMVRTNWKNPIHGCFQNRGTPKWMVYNRKPYILGWMIWGYHYFWKHPHHLTRAPTKNSPSRRRKPRRWDSDSGNGAQGTRIAGKALCTTGTEASFASTASFSAASSGHSSQPKTYKWVKVMSSLRKTMEM